MALILLISSSVSAETSHLTILHFNDLHGHVEQAAKIASEIKKIEKRNAVENHDTLVFLGGDMISGTPVSLRFKGEAEVAFLNSIGVDAMAIGNHEFDYGLDALKKSIASYEFPVVSANILYKFSGDYFVRPYSSDARSSIFGLTHTGTPLLTNSKNVSRLKFINPIRAAEKMVDIMPDPSGITIALTHEGVKSDISLAEKVKEIDLVVGGHDHVQPEEHCRSVGATLVCQTPPNGTYLGVIDLDIENGNVTGSRHELIKLDAKVKDDEKVAALMKPYLDAVSKEMAEVIGYASQDMPHFRGGKGTTKLGGLIAEAMKDEMGADIGMMNNGGIRTGLKKGKITCGDIESMLPFMNHIVKVEMKGIYIDEMLSAAKSRNRPMQLAGIADDETLEPEKKYTVATVDFLVNGGDDTKEFKKGRIIETSPDILKDVFIRYIRGKNKI